VGHLVILHPEPAFEALTAALHLVQETLLSEVQTTFRAWPNAGVLWIERNFV
jgi:hypothetical protein